ncbi:MAG TPA: phosphoglycerate mutase family protein [Vicinamibacterales bacterium]
MKRTILALVFLLTSAAAAAAQSTVFVVRHAERADGGTTSPMMGNDPDLSDAGRARAQALAAVLRDAGITAIFATEFKRTQQTAAPLAKALGISVTTVSAKEPGALIAKIKAASGNVLVVGHSNSVPDVVTGLGVTPPVTIGDAEYDNLFVVRLGDKPSVLRLHFK